MGVAGVPASMYLRMLRHWPRRRSRSSRGVPRGNSGPDAPGRRWHRAISCYNYRGSGRRRKACMQFGLSRRSVLVLILAVIGILPAWAAIAQDSYPSQNVRFVVAFPAGGPTDAVARILGERLPEEGGQGVVIENRGGAGGNIATRQVAKAEPNGYTVLVTTSAYAVNPSLTANAGYAPETDYKTAIVVATTPNIIVASPSLKASNLKELMELAKTEKLTYGMPGPGTTPHLSAEKIFKVLAKVDVPHVP